MTPALLDRFGRLHSYVRVSVTDRCNYRCVYCLPAEGAEWRPRKELLTYAEMARIIRVFARMGVRRVRLTGGEPTVRRDLPILISELATIPGIDDISMTTNAHAFASQAGRLAAAGLRRVNISLDSLDPVRFAQITRGGRLDDVLAGIDAARLAGLLPVKVNMVVMKGVNDDEILPMVRWAMPHADTTILRFIEYMPFGSRWHDNLSSSDIRRVVEQVLPLTPTEARFGDGPARYWTSGPLRLGFISPISEHFCATCNRLRLLADGQLRTCLAHEDTPSLRDLVRSGEDDAELERVIRQIVRGKPPGHSALEEGGSAFEGVMTGIGG